MDGENDQENIHESAPYYGEDSSVVSPLRNELVMDYTNHFTTFQYFESRDHLTSWVRNIGVDNGMVIVVKRSDVGRVSLACERNGVYRATKPKSERGKKENVHVLNEDEVRDEAKMKKKRNTGSKKCGCQFLLTGKQISEGEWELSVLCGVHNHPVSVDLTGHAYVGRLRKEEKELVDGMCEGNSRPKDILHKLKNTFKENKSTMKTLYNYRMMSGVRERGGKSQMQYLMSKVMEHDYRYFCNRCEETDTVRELFFAHPTSVRLLHAFPSVLLMDCTYKTNRYKLPLLEIVGVTSTGMTFQVACAYLEKEREENYLWACSKLKSLMNQSLLPAVIITDRELALMNAVEACFPTSTPLLCRWHISRNIVANCKKMFRTKDAWESFIFSWNVLVLADSEPKFNELIRRLQSDFAEYRAAVEYVMNQWVVPFKERFASAWTNNVMHFRNSTTNRAESQHSVLKKQLGSSMGNFETCWARIHTLLEISHSEIQASFEASINVVQHRFKSNLFKHLRGVVSIDGLSKILEELQGMPKGGVDPSTCGCVLRKTCGLPCAHELVEFVRDDKPIPLDMVDGFWRKLDMSESNIGVDDSVIADLGSHLDDAWGVVKSKFDCADEAEKRFLLTRLREIANPATTTLLTPEGPVVTRGRPPMRKGKKGVDQSTKREKSAFEYATSYNDSWSPIFVSGSQQSGDVPVFSKLPVRKNEGSSRTRSRYSGTLQFLPGNIHDYIVEVRNVMPDGHCGFRVIAAHLFNGGEHSFTRVRADLMQELSRNGRLYKNMFGDDGCLRLTEQLNCFEDTAPVEKWFSISEMGHMVANHYNVVLVSLAHEQCITFFPLTKEIPSTPRSIVMGFVNGNHYVQVILREGHPLPNVHPSWKRYRSNCAIGWEDAYKSQLDIFHMTRSSNSVTPAGGIIDIV